MTAQPRRNGPREVGSHAVASDGERLSRLVMLSGLQPTGDVGPEQWVDDAPAGRSEPVGQSEGRRRCGGAGPARTP
jgi:hypothetical protein